MGRLQVWHRLLRAGCEATWARGAIFIAMMMMMMAACERSADVVERRALRESPCHFRLGT